MYLCCAVDVIQLPKAGLVTLPDHKLTEQDIKIVSYMQAFVINRKLFISNLVFSIISNL